MQYFTFIITFLFLVTSGNMEAQDLSKHQWKNRVILLLTNDTNNLVFQKQLIAFKNDIDGMTERKLIVYKITPEVYSLGLQNDDSWFPGKIYSDFKKSIAPFEIILIGLDGGIKLRQTEFLSSEKLFALIDGMPMRRAEMKQNKN